MENLALCIRLEVAYARWIVADIHAAKAAAQDDASMRKLIALIYAMLITKLAHDPRR